MINVRIGYLHGLGSDVNLLDVRDRTESIVGGVFEEELDSVDVALECFGPDDDHSTDLFFTVEIAEVDVHHDLRDLTDQLIAQLESYLQESMERPTHFRVWVQRIQGQVAEVWTTHKGVV